MINFLRNTQTSVGEEVPRLTSTSSATPIRYNICNGLSHQLLYHAASIAISIQSKRPVEIPDYFIVSRSRRNQVKFLPSTSNSIPFGLAFDQTYFLEELKRLGANPTFVTYDLNATQIPCENWKILSLADPQLVLRIINAFQPSKRIEQLTKELTVKLKDLNLANGVCLHHRDGREWQNHCDRWKSVNDGVYRGNCMGVKDRTFLESLEDRGVFSSSFIFYCGESNLPNSLKMANVTVVTRKMLMSENSQRDVAFMKDGAYASELFTLIDFFACRQLPAFIGNSVSTFSAIQIALRESMNTFWYNSQSIPLSRLWKVYQMPIVYTYTELSKQSGKFLLEASIRSAREHMPNSTIHVLYHGQNDTKFRSWLRGQDIILHQHLPRWTEHIERMRQHGNPATSHLFLHRGNYLGTWQRIDIPNYVQSEYCLILDADTIITKPISLDSFDLDLTEGIAMSSELSPEDRIPVNAGVMLMNVPYLRRTYQSFLKFIRAHVKRGAFKHASPSDQGAYLVFYKDKNKFLTGDFNFKAYWNETHKRLLDPYLLHFHGPKPHDYISHILGDGCDEAIRILCQRARMTYVCDALRAFAGVTDHQQQLEYCRSEFNTPFKVDMCHTLFSRLNLPEAQCQDFDEMIRNVNSTVLARHLDILSGYDGRYLPQRSILVGWLLLSATVWKVRRRHDLVIFLTFSWAIIAALISLYVIQKS